MSDLDLNASINVSNDELRKAFDEDIKGLQALAKAAKQGGAEAAAAFKEAAAAQEELMDSVGATGAQYAKLKTLIDDVNAKIEQGGQISHSAAIGVGEMARGFGRVAQSGNLSAFAVREFTGAAFRLGDSLGSAGVGAAVGIATIGIGALIEYLESAKKKADELADRFQSDMERIAHAGSLAQTSAEETLLFSGDPTAAITGKRRGESDNQFLARSKGLEGLAARARELNAEIEKAKQNPLFSGGTGGGGRNIGLETLENQLKDVNDLVGKQGMLWSVADMQQRKLLGTEEVRAKAELEKKNDKLGARSVEEYHDPTIDAMVRETKAAGDLIPALTNEHDILVALQNQVALYRYELDHTNLSAEQRIEKTKQLAEAERAENKEMSTSVMLGGQRLQLNVQAARLPTLENKNTANSIKQQFRDIAKEWKLTVDSMTNTTTNLVDGILKGTTTIGGAFREMWGDAVLGAINAGIRMLAHHIAVELGMTEASATGTATRADLDMWAAMKKIAAGSWAAIVSIANYAWETIAATWAAISAIPFVGPFLAPAAALGAGALVMGLVGNIRSAAGGFDIPAGVNPMTQLHAQEMVLPADLANRVRSMAGGNGGGGVTHNHIYAMDSQSFVDFAKRNPDGFAHGVAVAVKNNHPAIRKALG